MVGSGLSRAKTAPQTLYGALSSEWHLSNEAMVLTVVVPANTTASVTLRNTTMAAAREGATLLSAAVGVLGTRVAGNDVIVRVGSGRYMFTTAAP